MSYCWCRGLLIAGAVNLLLLLSVTIGGDDAAAAFGPTIESAMLSESIMDL